MRHFCYTDLHRISNIVNSSIFVFQFHLKSRIGREEKRGRSVLAGVLVFFLVTKFERESEKGEVDERRKEKEN